MRHALLSHNSIYYAKVLNKWLTERGEESVGIRTIVRDRRRYEEQLDKRATRSSGVEKRLAQFQHVYEVFDVRLTLFQTTTARVRLRWGR